MENLAYYIKFLGLKSPVELTFKTKSNKHSDAVYWPKFNKYGKIKAHKITLYLGNQDGNAIRTIDELVAHELIHAWQEENSIAEFHGPKFIAMAKKMQDKFNLTHIYLADLDSE